MLGQTGQPWLEFSSHKSYICLKNIKYSSPQASILRLNNLMISINETFVKILLYTNIQYLPYYTTLYVFDETNPCRHRCEKPSNLFYILSRPKHPRHTLRIQNVKHFASCLYINEHFRCLQNCVLCGAGGV